MRISPRRRAFEPQRLLLVEDDTVLGSGLQTALAQTGYKVDWVQDGHDADLALESDPYDEVVLDLNLPGRSGLEVLEGLRGRGGTVPVLVITARDKVIDRIRALDSGADDYVVKPFDVDELCARLRALERRTAGRAAPLLRHGDLVMDPAAHIVTVAGTSLALSPHEFSILEALLENLGRVLSRQRLEDLVYGWDDGVGSNAVEVHIHHLRKKLPAELIRTVRGIGYIIERPK